MNKEDYSKYYIQGSDHYLIPKDVFDELFNEMVNWKEESKELKQKYLNAVVDYEITMSDKTELEKQLRTSAIFNEEDIRLDQTKEVFETLANILSTESCSYRYLIYDLLGFKKENYVDLIAGMSITNAIVELEELKKQEKSFIEIKNQQKEFIEYMNKTIEELECDDVGDEEMKGYLIQRIDTFKETLSKYKKIIGD